MTTSTADVVIVAAGASTRMGGVDKMRALVAGRPLLAWSIDAFARAPGIGRIVVVVPDARVAEIRAAGWLPPSVVVVAGGGRRQESVAAGVAALDERAARAEAHVSGAHADAGQAWPDGRVVLVHDGARPVVSGDLIERVVAAAAGSGAAIPVVPVVETLKRIEGGNVAGTVERDGLAAAQTPQGVQLGLLRQAWSEFPPAGPRTFTDEAALLEACTIPVRVVPGNVDNLKVTVAADLDRAAAVLGGRSARVGAGEDSHPFGPGEPLVLGGVRFEGAPSLSGHSDGDVVLHAVADALLGAAGLGDLGRLFPPDARTPRGIASSDMLETVVARLAAVGLAPSQLDVTIVGARPRLGDRLDAIRDRVAELARLDKERVSVKASTGNLFGAEGAGRGISARAVATVDGHR